MIIGYGHEASRRSTDSAARLLVVARFADRIEQHAFKPEERARAAFFALQQRQRGADTEPLSTVRDYKGRTSTTVWL
jgi:hypothetical protein